MKQDIRDIIDWLEEITNSKVEFVPTKGRHSKVRLQILGTFHNFPVPSKIRAGHERQNFYSQMRRKIDQRIEAVKARQGTLQ